MRLKGKLIDISRWDSYSLVILFFSIAFQLLKWGTFPIFVDIYYHLLSATGFNDAGGWVHSCFWEYAPVGRPQVYPPLLHMIILSLIKTGLPILAIGKLIQFVIYPLLLFTIWYVIRKIFDKQQAFFTLAMFFLSYPFYLSAVNTAAASISLILCLLSLLFLEKNKIITSAVFLAISFYSHGYTPWIFAFAFIMYGVFNRIKLSICLRVVLVAVCLAGPFLFFQFIKRDYFVFSRGLVENYDIEFDLVNWFFLLGGFLACLKRGGRHSVFLALFISSVVFLLSGYFFRYLSFYGIISIIFMNAVFFCDFYKRLEKKFEKTFLALFILFYVLSPALIIDLRKKDLLRNKVIIFSHDENLIINRGIFTLNPMNSSLLNSFFYGLRFIRTNETTIYYPYLFEEVAAVIKANSHEDDIIYANFPYTAGILSLLSHRATSTAMLSEVKPYEPFDKISVSKLIIWQKNSDDIKKEPLYLIEKYHLNKIADTKLAFIYKNPECRSKKQPLRAQISYNNVFVVMFLVFLFAAGSVKFGIDK